MPLKQTVNEDAHSQSSRNTFIS